MTSLQVQLYNESNKCINSCLRHLDAPQQAAPRQLCKRYVPGIL